jgi:hypothetical protein
MFAALQEERGTIRASSTTAAKPALLSFPAALPRPAAPDSMTAAKPRQFFIQGITRDGRTFRPSDWAERLAGAMSSFRPGGAAKKPGAHISYSPYCIPKVIDGVKCVVVSEALRDIELMAWDFVMNFARDNELQVVEIRRLPDDPATK